MDALPLLLAHPGSPPLIHVHHPHHPASSLRALATSLPARCAVARLDAVEHHTQRLLYAGAVSRLSAALDPEGEETGKEVITWDVFAREVRSLWAARRSKAAKGKGKGKEKANGVNGDHGSGGGPDSDDDDEGQIVIFVTKAERLRGVLGASFTAFTRLAELLGVPATVVLCSQMPWDDLRPARGDAPEPVHIYIEPLHRDEILALLRPGSEHPLYPRFLDLIIATMAHLVPTSPPSELDYVATALWPLYTATLPPHAEMTLLGKRYPDESNSPPPLAITVRLLTDLKHQLSLALASAAESVLPRTTGRAEFTRALIPFTPEGLPRPTSVRSVPRPPPLELPRAAQFLLVAAYCASYNPAKTDVRLFGRGTGPDGRRRRGGGTRRAGYGRVRVGKVPQRLLGPRPFPLDRLLAMFSSLYAEHAPRPEDLQASFNGDSDSEGEADGSSGGWLNPAAVGAAAAQRRRERELARDEAWEDEVDHLTFSAKLWALVPELEAQGLIKRTSPVDRLDGVMLRCEVGYETVVEVAKGLRITLDEYLYEMAA